MTIRSRLHIFIKTTGKHYYDIGLRKGNEYLSHIRETFGETHPRFLEDFIDKFGKQNVIVRSLGKLHEDADYIISLFED